LAGRPLEPIRKLQPGLAARLLKGVLKGLVVGKRFELFQLSEIGGPAVADGAAYSSDEPPSKEVEPPASQVPLMLPIVAPLVTSVETVPEQETPAAESAPARKSAPAKPVDELSLLQRARRALAKEPNEALSLVRRHEREYPNGKYVQEREVIRIEALRNVGKGDEAERRGEDFKRRFPGSAHKSKLDREGR
jgi:hypothetical protein